MKNKITKLNTGFTLIETMISVSLFIIIVMAAMTALLNANLLQQKSSDMRSIMDNLSFVMEDMSNNLRTGYDYQCFSGKQTLPPFTLTTPQSCPTGGWAIEFESQDNNPYAYYISDDYHIFRSEDGFASDPTGIQLTPDEVVIDPLKSSFTVVGAEPPSAGGSQQPFVTIKLVGTITSHSQGITTPFSLQTSVSQRKLNI